MIDYIADKLFDVRKEDDIIADNFNIRPPVEWKERLVLYIKCHNNMDLYIKDKKIRIMCKIIYSMMD